LIITDIYNKVSYNKTSIIKKYRRLTFQSNENKHIVIVWFYYIREGEVYIGNRKN